ncbi:hypothetical protein K525DRAFT_197074 [Schizophyllum commune Loenen D]|nr:hypothetical protein K525DRAFT_197074 [Schizophyllum commune Loenen D]
MSDPRFARLRTDPRFRKVKRKEDKVVVDERFKGLFAQEKGKSRLERVDKYGRSVSSKKDQDDLNRYYRLERGEDDEILVGAKPGPDYARGAVLMESSDEEEDEEDKGADDSDDEGEVVLGQDSSRPIAVPRDDEDAEIDLDEDTVAVLDAQVAAYEKTNPLQAVAEGSRTNRLAVVNLDWDHVRAIHLYKIFSSLVSPTAPTLSSGEVKAQGKTAKGAVGGSHPIARGKVLSVRVYPSSFGKERMAREEVEGPPAEIFGKKNEVDEEEINERTVYEVGEEGKYDEDALRKYQLERLRYYYAIVECDTVEAASHIYAELEGTELERSANVFDLSFVPDGMTFDEEPRDEATNETDAPDAPYKAVDFVTDALRHSKVKLTWDEDDPERAKVTRRAFTKKEIEEADFRQYIASSGSEDEDEGEDGEGDGDAMGRKKAGKKASRDRLRALLLGGGESELPEGWGAKDDDDDVDMEITFTPGLSEKRGDGEETTLDKYQRKMREKRRKRKEEMKERHAEKEADGDDFFEVDDEPAPNSNKSGKHGKKPHKASKPDATDATPTPRIESTAAELALVATSDNPSAEPAHFDMKAILKAEKKKGKKGRGKKRRGEEEKDLQEDFTLDVNDERFKVLHEDPSFAIDPTNPQFKKTKAMSALLEERIKRRKSAVGDGEDARKSSHKRAASPSADDGARSLQNLVESVKRKSASSGGGSEPRPQKKRKKAA